MWCNLYNKILWLQNTSKHTGDFMMAILVFKYRLYPQIQNHFYFIKVNSPGLEVIIYIFLNLSFISRASEELMISASVNLPGVIPL